MRRVLLMITALLLVSGLVGLVTTGCSSVQNAAVDYMGGPATDSMGGVELTEKRNAEEFDSAVPYDNDDGETREEEIEERIIKTGRMAYVSDDVKEKVEEINEVLENYGADTQASSLTRINDRDRASLTIRIESNHFDSVYNSLGELDNLVSKESTSREVTMEYVDLQRRLEVFRTQEERYLEMLDKAENIEEMLAVEKELGRIRVEIESIQGKLKYFDSVTDYSYIDITVEQRKSLATAPRAPDNIWEEFLFSFTEGWHFFSALLVSILASLIWSVPFILTIGVIITIIIIIKKRNAAKE